jgi:hypothetical protein
VSEMIERVAKAMWDARRANANNNGVELEFWGDGSIPKANGIMDEARAAIEAMREPTGAMVIAGRYPAGGGPEAEATWEAMIDAALDNGK